MEISRPTQKLLFVLGKGGVGRSTVAAALADSYALEGERVLVVQWSVHDSISPQFGSPSVLSHKARDVTEKIATMSFSADEAMREYFVDHLKMKWVHKVVIENKHVKRFVNAAPGVQELFFLGRLYWLVCLAQQERGWSYDRIIVDAPAMGHGVSLFRIAPTIAGLGMTGPLATECERVSGLLRNADLVASVVVTLPEELPIEETLEFLPKIEQDLGRPPLFVVLNRAFVEHFAESEQENLRLKVTTEEAKQALDLLVADLRKREGFSLKLRQALGDSGTPLMRILDAHLVHSSLSAENVREELVREFRSTFLPAPSGGVSH